MNCRKTIYLQEIYQNKVWALRAVELVESSPDQIVVWCPRGSGLALHESYFSDSKFFHKNRWDIASNEWSLTAGTWQHTHVLTIKDPSKYYSIQYFWDAESSEFLFYYINFDLPYTKTSSGFSTLDLDLDLIVYSNGSFEWKDEVDYKNAAHDGFIKEDWYTSIELAREEVISLVESMSEPLDGHWLNWLDKADTTPIELSSNLMEYK